MARTKKATSSAGRKSGKAGSKAKRAPKKKEKKTHLDLERERLTEKDGKYYFDVAAADHAVLFFEKYLRHSKGEWAGKPLKLEAWQKDRVIRPLFGWKHSDSGFRRFRVLWFEEPSGNGKSVLSSGIALYMQVADGEPGAEVYSAASDRIQAKIVFEQSKVMVEWSPELLARLNPMKSAIVDRATGTCIFRAIASDARRQEGFNTHCCAFDEMHTQPDSRLWTVIKKSTGKRRQPLIVVTTTAGDEVESIAWDLHDYARQVLERKIEDDSWLVIIDAADKDEDWTDEEVWKRVNPNLGISPKIEALREECLAAQHLPRLENSFRRYRLNQWVGDAIRWIPMHHWAKCKGDVDYEKLKGSTCFAAMDLSSTTDITALILGFRNGKRLKLLPFFWLPEENIESGGRDSLNSETYKKWVAQGFLLTTPGNAIDHDAILNKIEELKNDFIMEEIALDPWHSSYVTPKLEELEIEPVEFRQGYGSMSEPSKRFEAMVLKHLIEHGDHPVLNWMMDNVVATEDDNKNIKPHKRKSRKKIDGVIGTVMVVGRAFSEDEDDDSGSGGLSVLGGSA